MRFYSQNIVSSSKSVKIRSQNSVGSFAKYREQSRICLQALTRMAKRSGTETAAILDVAKRLDIIHEDNYQKGRELLIRIIMMLTKLAQKSD